MTDRDGRGPEVDRQAAFRVEPTLGMSPSSGSLAAGVEHPETVFVSSEQIGVAAVMFYQQIFLEAVDVAVVLKFEAAIVSGAGCRATLSEGP
jgi:hypothetical protein